MTIDHLHFTPWASLFGGALIGASAGLFVLGAGRIAGISGSLGTALDSTTKGDLAGQGFRLMFLAGLIAAPWLWQSVAVMPTLTSVARTPTLVLAGLLVGIGVRMGHGCTSGHGVCRLARLSKRSLVNVGAFMLAGMVAVAIMDRLSVRAL